MQDEINEIEVRIAEEESRVPPGAPSGPHQAVPVDYPPPPEEENEEDAQMENDDTGAGVGDFVSPSKKR